jgi:hypothetical protein
MPGLEIYFFTVTVYCFIVKILLAFAVHAYIQVLFILFKYSNASSVFGDYFVLKPQ